MSTPSVAKVDPRFQKQMEALTAWLDKTYRTLSEVAADAWYVPDLNGWDGDLFAVDQLAKAFDRQALGQQFQDATTSSDKGNRADLGVIQLQADLLAALERAYRNRHASVIRNEAHAAMRHEAHALPFGPITQGYLGTIEALLRKAGTAQ